MTSAMAASNWSDTTTTYVFALLVVQLLHAKEMYFCSFVTIQSSMHQIFTQMYLTVSIGQSHMERPTESFIKKFFYRGDSHPIFPHLNLPPNKSPPKQVDTILPSSRCPSNKFRRHMNPVVNN